MVKAKVRARGGYALAGDQVARAIIGNGERIAVLPIAQHELPFVVSAPKAVRFVRGDQRRAFGLVTPPLKGLHQAMTIARHARYWSPEA